MIIGIAPVDEVWGPGGESFTCFLAFLFAVGYGLYILLRNKK